MTWYRDSTLLYEADVTLQKKSEKLKRDIESDDILVSNIIAADDSPVYYNLMMIKEFSDLQMENEKTQIMNHRSSGFNENDVLDNSCRLVIITMADYVQISSFSGSTWINSNYLHP